MLLIWIEQKLTRRISRIASSRDLFQVDSLLIAAQKSHNLGQEEGLLLSCGFDLLLDLIHLFNSCSIFTDKSLAFNLVSLISSLNQKSLHFVELGENGLAV